jgi:hypothetical protein
MSQPSGATLVVLAAGRAKRYGGCKPLAPVGPAGEAVIDLLASDALSAGFSTIVLVVGAATGDAIRYHVAHTWPRAVDARFARQATPSGTVDAVLAAGDQLDPGIPFGVGNADDLYGEVALGLLADHVGANASEHALVGFRLRNAVIGRSPVTRGVCTVDAQGLLTGIEERRQVTPTDGRFVAGDGRQPLELDPDASVSMNLWGFQPGVWPILRGASARARSSTEAEVLLPDMVAAMVSANGDAGAAPFRVLPADGRCIGVTHPDDLALVQADIAAQIGRGERPARLWTALG